MSRDATYFPVYYVAVVNTGVATSMSSADVNGLMRTIVFSLLLPDPVSGVWA
ncbi:MAG: hypothetical protein ACP5T9_06545 [Thermoplasmata archaeon]